MSLDKTPNRNRCVKRITRVYKGLKEKCYNVKNIGYKYYGGKGIKVLLSRIDFIQWYLDHVTDDMVRPCVDRIDRDGHYSIDNIQIISAKKNSRKTIESNPAWEEKLDNMSFANNERMKEVTINGIKYNSAREAERAIGMHHGSILKAVKIKKTNVFETKQVLRLKAIYNAREE